MPRISTQDKYCIETWLGLGIHGRQRSLRAYTTNDGNGTPLMTNFRRPTEGFEQNTVTISETFICIKTTIANACAKGPNTTFDIIFEKNISKLRIEQH